MVPYLKRAFSPQDAKAAEVIILFSLLLRGQQRKRIHLSARSEHLKNLSEPFCLSLFCPLNRKGKINLTQRSLRLERSGR
jgi:hypothetical protein